MRFLSDVSSFNIRIRSLQTLQTLRMLRMLHRIENVVVRYGSTDCNRPVWFVGTIMLLCLAELTNQFEDDLRL